MLPKKAKRPKMGVREPVRLVFNVHRAFVKRHGCAIRGCMRTPIEFAHLRTAANSGMGRKPMDCFGVGLCQEHHREAHQHGHDTMARRNGMTLDQLFALAAEFTRATTDRALREAVSA